MLPSPACGLRQRGGTAKVNHLSVLARPFYVNTQRRSRWIGDPDTAQAKPPPGARLDDLDPTGLYQSCVAFGVAAGL
jgi:hypothetical protein